MRRRQVLVFVAGAAALLATGCAQAAAVRAPDSWGRAITVPGLGALNKGRNADVSSVSCPSPGSCAAGGVYTDGGRHQQGFVVRERNGRWHRAVEVPGLGALNKGGNAQVSSVSCASPGNCAAGGYYGSRDRNYVVTSGRGFVVSERNGRWHRAVEVPGLGALNKGGNAQVSSVSCASPGSCAAGGFYRDGNGHQQGFVAVERNGRWGQAVEVPGLGTLNKGGNAGVSSVSCASLGNCAAVGDYRDGGRHQQGFVVSEKNGSWGTAQEVAGSLNDGGGATVTSVSCASAGNCSAGGQYDDGSGSQQAFVISEVNGTWASAQEVAGSMNDVGGDASVTSVSCAPAGNCSAGGQLETGGAAAAFVVSEKNGAWGQAIYVPGLNAVARFAYLNSVSCSSAGNCAAGGDYEGFGSGVFVVREKNGVWGHETTVPGLGALNKGSSLGVSSVSCAPAGNCVAGGYYQETGRYALQGFVT
jgi:hypothetical protein